MASFFSKLFGSLFSGGDPEAEKKRVLKGIAKNLSKTKYKFYKIGSDQVLPSFGKFFFELYKILSPAQLSFQQQMNPALYKNMVIDYSLSDEQKVAIEELSEENITAMMKNVPFNQLKEKVASNIELLSSGFDMDRINKVDDLYNKLIAFKAFCLYDYYFMLKKFDSSIREGDFGRSPKLEPIDASYIADDLKEFVAVMYVLPFGESWDDLMQMFKTLKGVEPVKPAQWSKICARLNGMRTENIFDMMIQLITKNPSYHTDVEIKRETVVEAYLDKIKNQAQATIRKLESDQKNSKVGSLLLQIFGTPEVVSLKNYTENGSAIFERKGLGSYQFAKPLNCLKAFLVEYVKKELREFSDLVVVRGQWSNQALSSQMSDDYNLLLESCEEIIAYDDKLSEDREIGTKIKTLLPQTERSKDAANIIKTTLKDVNDFAKNELVKCTRALISYAKNVKAILEDHKKQRPELIINWKELERFAEHPVDEVAVEIYKKIYLLASLMQNFLN